MGWDPAMWPLEDARSVGQHSSLLRCRSENDHIYDKHGQKKTSQYQLPRSSGRKKLSQKRYNLLQGGQKEIFTRICRNCKLDQCPQIQLRGVRQTLRSALSSTLIGTSVRNPMDPTYLSRVSTLVVSNTRYGKL